MCVMKSSQLEIRKIRYNWQAKKIQKVQTTDNAFKKIQKFKNVKFRTSGWKEEFSTKINLNEHELWRQPEVCQKLQKHTYTQATKFK